jgi:hypothetical protein
MYSASSISHLRSSSYNHLANLSNYHLTISNYVVIVINMSVSTAIYTLLI